MLTNFIIILVPYILINLIAKRKCCFLVHMVGIIKLMMCNKVDIPISVLDIGGSCLKFVWTLSIIIGSMKTLEEM